MIDEKFKEVSTIKKSIGLLQWTWLPYGIKTASSIFQKVLENVLLGKIENMIIYQDDICVRASSKSKKKQKKRFLKELKKAWLSVKSGQM